MVTVRQLRTFSIGKARNLWIGAAVALKDAKAPAQYVSAGRRFDAAYDAGMSCALLIAECEKVEISGQGHHAESLKQMADFLGLKGQTADAIPAMIQARNASRYDATPIANEAVLADAIKWAERIIAETEGWLQKNHPNVLKK
jgi:hypothetical protein